jgi:hypothetical protein
MGKRATNGKKPVQINGIKYPSQRAAARDLSITQSVFNNRIRKGLDPLLKGNPPFKKSMPTTIDGVDYPSLRAAARSLGVSKSTIAYRMKKVCNPLTGKSLLQHDLAQDFLVTTESRQEGSFPQKLRAGFESSDGGLKTKKTRKLPSSQGNGDVKYQEVKIMGKVSNKKKKNVLIDGVTYSSLSAASRALSISRNILSRRIKKGLDPLIGDGRTSDRSKPITLGGVTYPSQRAAAHALKINESTLSQHIRAEKQLSQSSPQCEPLRQQPVMSKKHQEESLFTKAKNWLLAF